MSIMGSRRRPSGASRRNVEDVLFREIRDLYGVIKGNIDDELMADGIYMVAQSVNISVENLLRARRESDDDVVRLRHNFFWSLRNGQDLRELLNEQNFFNAYFDAASSDTENVLGYNFSLWDSFKSSLALYEEYFNNIILPTSKFSISQRDLSLMERFKAMFGIFDETGDLDLVENTNELLTALVLSNFQFCRALLAIIADDLFPSNLFNAGVNLHSTNLDGLRDSFVGLIRPFREYRTKLGGQWVSQRMDTDLVDSVLPLVNSSIMNASQVILRNDASYADVRDSIGFELGGALDRLAGAMVNTVYGIDSVGEPPEIVKNFDLSMPPSYLIRTIIGLLDISIRSLHLLEVARSRMVK